MVSANEGDAVGVAYFEAEEKQEGFERVEAAVDKVACEDVLVWHGEAE